MAFEQVRDLRSDTRDTKRVKDHNHKWARGNRPSPGVKTDIFSPGDFLTGSEEQQEKIRPHRLPHGKHIRSPNITKSNGYCRGARIITHSSWRSKADSLTELHDSSNMSQSLRELLPSLSSRRKQSVSDDVLYSFDHTESPGKPLSLDIFVKTNTKETEKFVEKEYEILDYNGEAVKGRKALKDLHRGKMIPQTEEPELVEDEGFELV
ncbi:hypothetical protein SAMD00023353_5700780 [Rosellinia necatrix]|uniref:Uncharacterized protein n=1 Tax=Rosellinia necatrix TaxID=77044 RepID=A0A1W2TTQ1_ROSNE|nr:hypothetical protein SAMD00023353_5700780 [Rosellinia necatrix]